MPRQPHVTRRPRLRRLLLVGVGVAGVVPAAAAAITLINYFVLIAILGQQMGMFLPAKVPGDCDGERKAVTVTLAGDLEARLRVGRSDGRLEYHIHPVDVTGSGAHEVAVRLVGAANGEATPGAPFRIQLRLVGSSDLGSINTPADVTLMLAPDTSDGTVDARVLRIRALDPCDRDNDSSEATPPKGEASSVTPLARRSADTTLGASAAFAGAAFLGIAAIVARRRAPRSASAPSQQRTASTTPRGER